MKKRNEGMQNTGCKLWSVSWLIQDRLPVNLFYMPNQSTYPVNSDISLKYK